MYKIKAKSHFAFGKLYDFIRFVQRESLRYHGSSTDCLSPVSFAELHHCGSIQPPP